MTTDAFWQTIRILAACALSYAIADLSGLKEAYWALITAVGVMQPGLDDTLIASRNRVLGTLIGALAGLIVLEAVQAGLPRNLLFWCALVPLAALTAVRQSLRLSCVTLIVVVLVPSDGGPFARPLDRVFGILIGTVGSVATALVIHARRQRVSGRPEKSAPAPAIQTPQQGPYGGPAGAATGRPQPPSSDISQIP